MNQLIEKHPEYNTNIKTKRNEIRKEFFVRKKFGKF